MEQNIENNKMNFENLKNVKIMDEEEEEAFNQTNTDKTVIL